MPATPSIDSFSVTSTVNLTISVGADTSHVQFDRDWVGGTGTADDEAYLPTGSPPTSFSFPLPSGYGSFTIAVRARINSTASSWVTRGFTLAMPRPSNFSWTNTKASEGIYNLTESEWNGFLNRINDFRAYKGLGAYSFNRTVTSGILNSYVVPSASSYNAAINAITTMSPSSALPSYVGSGQMIYAYHFTQLRDALNSIS